MASERLLGDRANVGARGQARVSIDEIMRRVLPEENSYSFYQLVCLKRLLPADWTEAPRQCPE